MTKPAQSSFLKGRSEFVMVGVILTVAVLMLIGLSSMHVLGKTQPGPDFIPQIVVVLLFLAAIALAINIIRHPEEKNHLPQSTDEANISRDLLHDIAAMDQGEDTVQNASGLRNEPDQGVQAHVATQMMAQVPKAYKTYSDWKTLGGVFASFVVFIVILNPVGWVISAAALFWAIAYFLGSKRPIFDLGVALIFSSIIQLIFGGLLGLALPAGFVGGF